MVRGTARGTPRGACVRSSWALSRFPRAAWLARYHATAAAQSEPSTIRGFTHHARVIASCTAGGSAAMAARCASSSPRTGQSDRVHPAPIANVSGVTR